MQEFLSVKTIKKQLNKNNEGNKSKISEYTQPHMKRKINITTVSFKNISG